MPTETLNETNPLAAFPAEEVKRRLLIELKKIADQRSVLRPEWEPLLDSKRVVGTILALEDIFPFKLAPDKVVQKGGYNCVDDALDDMLDRMKGIWTCQIKKEQK